ncbi:hypothetical protein [Pseudorhodoferax sp.]|uniref:hypothetical protein n=1 Tax=Pseudorhodoferax sp. TaxID=1993553 RepID=UPI0039E6B1B0
MPDFAQHHLVAMYVLIACLVLPVLVLLVYRTIVRRRQRLAREAMQRGNVLYRSWLERSKTAQEPPPSGS